MRSTTEVLEQLLSDGRSTSKDFLFLPNTPEGDILSICSEEFGRSYAIAEYVRGITNLNGFKKVSNDSTLHASLANIFSVSTTQITDLISTDLDNFAEGYGETRHPARAAKGPLKLIFSTNDPVSVASGTTFKSRDGTVIYETVEELTSITPALSEGDYYIYVQSQAQTTGDEGNVVQGSTFYATIDITNLQQVTIPFTIDNGTDKETDADFIVRIELSREAHGVGSKSWLQSIVLGNANVYDIALYSVLDKTDGTFHREYGIDVWVHALEDRKLIKDEPIIEAEKDHIYKIQPLVSESQILDTTNVSTVTAANPLETGYARSVLSPDKVRVKIPNTTISYFVDQTIIDIQTSIEDPDNWIFGGRSLVLVKKAKEVKIDITNCKYFLAAGHTQAIVEEAIANNLQKFYTGGTVVSTYTRRTIGEDIDKSDILNVILDTTGIDRVDLTSFAVLRLDEAYSSTDPVRIDYWEYANLGSVTLVLGG